jgi:hypothetical protein
MPQYLMTAMFSNLAITGIVVFAIVGVLIALRWRQSVSNGEINSSGSGSGGDLGGSDGGA